MTPAAPSQAVAPYSARQVSAASDAARQYLDAVERTLRHCRREIPHAASLAEPAADALARGGSLYIAGDPGLVAEAVGRAGGLMMIQPISPPQLPPPHAVVIFGWKTPQELEVRRAWLEQLHEEAVETVGIGASSPPKEERTLFAGTLLTQDREVINANGKRWCPVGAIGNATNLWTFTGELIASLSRRHRTPTIWQSIWVPGSKERNAPRIGQPYDPTLTLQPLPPRRLADEYVDSLLQSVKGMRSDLPAFVDAAADLQTARSGGHQAWLYIMAHMVGLEIGGKADPGYLKPLPERLDPDLFHPGDALLGLGYVGIPPDVETAARAHDVKMTWFTAPGAESPPSGGRWIDARWKLGDAAVSLPGYDVGALPPSGVLQLTAYWTVTAAMLELKG